MDNYEVMNLLLKMSKEDDNSNTKTFFTFGVVVLAGVVCYQYWRNATTTNLLYGLREEQGALNRMCDNLLSENQRLQQNQKNLQQIIASLGRERQELIDKLKQQERKDSADNK